MVRPALFRSFSRGLALASVLGLVASAQAQTFTWSSAWTVPSVTANSATTTPGNFIVNLNGSSVSTDTATTNILLSTENSQILAGDTGIGTFNRPVTLNLTLSGITQSLNLNLAGNLNGAGGGSSTLGISGFPASLVYSTGGGTFTVDNFLATAIGTPSAPLPGSISARVTFAASGVSAPEPGTVALVLLGFGGLAVARRRK